ncbi:ABC transporter ATP-binding protein [Catellatospora chokoriensis]|uniref:Multidrug ABC transporter permease n=2 Tax=Catellatospora chokoriensis TaxID=310353 RepID=A0A8J3NVE9_9ACTN|nr:multidrug ABC transporter permease [Catellatospora chokoriensis]
MTQTSQAPAAVLQPPRPRTAGDAALPEMRTMWWETGMRARADAGLLAVFAEIPQLIRTALGIAWRADRARTLTVAGATVGAGILSALGLLATQRVLVELFAAGPTPDRVWAALPALIMLAATAAIRAGLSIVTGFAQNGLSPRVDRDVERRLFEATTSVRLEAFDADAFADDMERAGRGSSSVIGLVQGTLNLLAGLSGIVAVTAAVVVIEPVLLAALLVATVPNVWAALSAGHQRYRTYIAGSVRRRRLGVLHRLMAERDSAAELRSYGLRGFLLAQYDQVMGAETKIQLDLARRITITTTIGSLTSGIASTAVYVLLGVLLLNGDIPLAAAATCVIAVQAAQRHLSMAAWQVDRVYDEGVHVRDYQNFLARSRQHMPEVCGSHETAPLDELHLDKVTFAFPERDTPAVVDVSLTIRHGQTVALVGENGSGKSTLAAVIAGLREPDGGSIRWNGRDYAEHDPDGLRARIAVVRQDFYKWPLSVVTNIALGDIDADPDPDRIHEAAGRAVAHPVIAGLPHGYETLLDRTFADGQDLSGGQWQRITSARGLYRDADLLVMDEPSSALDPRAEDALFQAIRDRQGQRTTILITHRLANIRHADLIVVMHDGRIVQSGSHDELIADGGLYSELYTLQARGYGEAVS